MQAKSIVLLLAGALAGCRAGGTDIAIGAAGPFSEGYGLLDRQGIELALKQINARGGVRGRPLRLVAADDSANPMRAVQIAEGFVADPSIVGVVGHVNSGAMMMAARVYDGRLAAIATAASSQDLTGISPWVFRTISSDSANGLDMARYANRLGRQRAAILFENDSYGRGLAALFRRQFAGEILSADPIASGTTDFEPYVAWYKARRPDLVFMAGTEMSGRRFLKEARRQKLEAEFMGGDGWIGVAVDTANAEGVIVATPFTPADPRPEAKAFVEAFRAAYGRDPDGNAALGYDAARTLARAIDAVGTDREAIRDWLAAIDEKSALNGVTGPVRFHTTGDRLGRGIMMTRVRRGTLTVEGGE